MEVVDLLPHCTPTIRVKGPMVSMPNSDKELNKDQMRLASWLATPKDYREPGTLGELAEEIGVSPSTLSRWRRNLWVDEMAAEIARQELFEHLPEVYNRLAEKATEGSYQHTCLFLEMTNKHCQSMDITLNNRRSLIEELRGSDG